MYMVGENGPEPFVPNVPGHIIPHGDADYTPGLRTKDRMAAPPIPKNLGAHMSLILTHRQNGGPVSAGSPYMVGEDGPEPFVPSGRSYGGYASGGGGNDWRNSPPVIHNHTWNITTPDANSFRQSQGQIGQDIARATSRAHRRNG